MKAAWAFLKSASYSSGRGIIAEDARHFRGCAQRGEIEAAAIGAFAAGGPFVVGLIGEAAVFDQAVAVGVELFQVIEGFAHGFVVVAQEVEILAAAEDVIAPDHQDVFAIEVAPVGDVLPTVLIDIDERIFIGVSQIVRRGAGRLALDGDEFVLALEHPAP